jgi:DNA-binding NtrC family response regulator
MVNLRVLIIDDEVMYSKEVAEFLKSLNYQVVIANHPFEGLKILEQQEIDLIVLDIKMPEMDGITLLKKVRELYPNIEVIMITGHGDMDSVIDALRLGALDFINKPFGAFEIQSSIERCRRFIELSTNYKEMKEHYNAAANELKSKFGHEIIGESESIQKVISLMSKVSQTNDTSVLITGESGTGKELVARGIHYLSDRRNNYFFDVNCSSIPESLFESEFFGHSRGSFTGAVSEKAGWFEVANKGTLFLDEIGDMPLSQQIKLLRVLEQRKIRRVGSTKDIDVDVRIIAASNQDLEKLVKENKFRMDLYHRLKSFTIHLEPLRERKSDISILLHFFVTNLSTKMRKNIQKIDKEVYEKLARYNFPGNIRELKNLVERAIIIADSNELKLKDFALPFIDKTSDREELFCLEEIEKKAILRVLQETKYKNEAAKLLGITPQSLERRIKKYRIEGL